MFKIGDIVRMKKECIWDSERQEGLRVVIEYLPKNDHLLVCNLDNPHTDERLSTRGEYHELVERGNVSAKSIAEDIISKRPTGEEVEKQINDLRDYILSLGNIKKYVVEFRENYTDIFDNWLEDYVEAENEIEALELAKQWLIDHGYDGDVDELEYKVTEYQRQ